MEIQGKIIDIQGKKIFNGVVTFTDGIITSIKEVDNITTNQYILPGFIDAHVHIESSMLPPSEFARLAVVHGTVATVSDPHEIGNVLGKDGVLYMLEDGKQVNFKFYFGAPSCVPATPFETAGATISVDDLQDLFELSEIKYLAEMMNWPGVLNRDSEVMDKIALAHQMNKPVDGHAPGLRGDDAKKYIRAGITTDHECFTKDEALDKLAHGMKIIIREGSAAKNFDALISLLPEYSDQIMFCSDDKHPDNLVEGHINQLVMRSLDLGYDLFQTLKAACVNPVDHYGLDVGLLKPGDPADFIIIDNLETMNVLETRIKGIKVAESGSTLIERTSSSLVNNFQPQFIEPQSIQYQTEQSKIRVIECEDGQLVTKENIMKAKKEGNLVVPDLENDILKLVVLNRYTKSSPAVAFIKNFGLRSGAIASSVAHDSHNIIAVGTNDMDLANVISIIARENGGIGIVDKSVSEILPLPIAGLMSDQDGYDVADRYSYLDGLAKEMGSKLRSPFMTLSFMALLVIPSLKLSDKGLFDGNQFKFVSTSL